MTITYISCYLSIHQVPVCNAFYDLLGDDFKYIATNEMPSWRVISGYSDLNSKYSYVVKAYENQQFAYSLADNSDIVIIGSASDKYIVNRLKNNKLTFRCCERFYKEGNNKSYVRDYLASWLHHGRFQKMPLYMLCASAYTSIDCYRFNNYRGKVFKWGYFPETKEYDLDLLFENKRDELIQLLWVGRLIDWKHPEKAIEVASYLKNNSVPFRLNIIGDGELFDYLSNLIDINGLKEEVY